MDGAPVTAFGAAFAAPGQTAAVLRARAVAAGLPAREPAPADLLAAVVGAQAWLCALGVPSLAQVPGEPAAAALAAVYCRAAGHATAAVPHTPARVRAQLARLTAALDAAEPRALPQAALAAVQAAADWAGGHGAGPGVLLAAAADLAAGWADPALVAVSEALLTLAAERL